MEVKIHLPIMKVAKRHVEGQWPLRGDATAGAQSAVAIGADGGRGLGRGLKLGEYGEEGCEGIY